MKINLDDVTLVVVDCLNPELAKNAILQSQKFCEFNKSLLFTDIKSDNLNFDVIQIDRIGSIKEYSEFIFKKLNSYIVTKFIIIAQWDGYVVNSKTWTNDFRKYDYIGAKWHWHKDGKNIGNGGFSFRSKKLLELTSSDEFPFLENEPEDEQICITYREYLVSK